MTIRFVKYCLSYKLPCANAVKKDIILCLQSADLIIQPDPPCSLPITTIEAQICQAFTLCDGCQTVVWNYTFSYDDTQLTNPTTPLTAGDITGVFCKDCLTDWVQEQISCLSDIDIVCVVDSNSIDFSIYEGCVTGEVKVSQDAGNEIVLHADGIYAPTGGGGGGNDWHILGNSGTIDGTNFLGTIDTIPFQIRVNNLQVAKFYKAGTPDPWNSQTIILGDTTNTIDPSAIGIGNSIFGGSSNRILSADENAVVMGESNTLDSQSGLNNLILGGFSNSITSLSRGLFGGADGCTIIGGNSNAINDNLVHASSGPTGCVISGGNFNIIDGSVGSLVVDISYNTIAGGSGCLLEDTSHSFIGSGEQNRIFGDATHSHDSDWNFIGGGELNTLVDCAFSVICGGNANQIDGTNLVSSVICGGGNNEIKGSYSTILGGQFLKLGANSLGFGVDKTLFPPVDVSAFSNIGYFGNVDIWIGNFDNTARKLKFFEPNTVLNYSTSNYSSFKAQAQGANIDYVWPAAAGTAGQQLTIDTVVGTVVTLKWA